MKKQQGFTLIELVTVIIILGILAAFAVPRFINLSSEAKAASIKGLSGSVKAASALAHAAYIVKDVPTSTTVAMGGQTVTIKNAYPEGSADGIVKALDISNDYQLDTSTTGSVVFYQSDQSLATTPATCIVTYEEAGGAGDAPSVTTDTDCS